MIGVDIVEVSRFAGKTEKFYEKMFTAGELEYIESKGVHFAETAAGIFAAKEAVLKLLECGIGGGLQNVEILHRASGAPYVTLHGELPNLCPGGELSISISHTADSAVAVAQIEGKRS